MLINDLPEEIDAYYRDNEFGGVIEIHKAQKKGRTIIVIHRKDHKKDVWRKERSMWHLQC